MSLEDVTSFLGQESNSRCIAIVAGKSEFNNESST